MQIKIEKLAYGGKGIGRINDKICFVQNALPGETVEIEIIQEKKNFIEARSVRIIESSPVRETPPCIHYGACGGCQYQHLPYEEELRWKEIQLREYLQKQFPAPDSVFKPIIGSDSPYHYRNHLTLHLTQENKWGFVNEDNESRMAIQSCALAKPELNEWLAQSSDTDKKPNRITIRAGAANKVITSAEDIFFNIPMKAAADSSGDGMRLRTHSRCFFQNNIPVTMKIAAILQTLYAQQKPGHFWDLYAGVGTFTALLNPRQSQTLCVESNPNAVEALQMNLQNAGLAAEIAPEPVENCIEDILQEERRGTVFALLDPPREGLHPDVTRALTQNEGPDQIAYLSCHMGALGRDLKALSAEKYQIVSIQAFDMFPRTQHIETLAVLKRKG